MLGYRSDVIARGRGIFNVGNCPFMQAPVERVRITLRTDRKQRQQQAKLRIAEHGMANTGQHSRILEELSAQVTRQAPGL